MATILTVHGTYSSGAQQGDQWWQGGSQLEADFLKLLEAESGQLRIERVVWNGFLSEVSRREAAKTLLDKVRELEGSQEPYCLIGHSHGGSVISHALLLAADGEMLLPKLTKWITIGTPFIASVPRKLLFSRLQLLGKTLYLSLLLLSVIVSTTILMSFSLPVFGRGFDLWLEQHRPSPPRIPYIDVPLPYFEQYLDYMGPYMGLFISFVASFGLPILVWIFVTRFSSWRLARIRTERIARARELFAHKWLCLLHPQDEATNALSALHKSRFRAFPDDFAAPAFSFASLFIPLTLLVLTGASDAATVTIFNMARDYVSPVTFNKEWFVAADGTLLGGGDSFVVNVGFLMWTITAGIGLLTLFLLSMIELDKNGPAVYVVFIVIGACLLFVVSLVITGFVKVASKYVSMFASEILNRLTRRQIINSAFGFDLVSETAISVNVYPWWCPRAPLYLPESLAEEIELFSNRQAGATVVKFRSAMSTIAVSGKFAIRASLSDYISWNELIHTSYFNVAGFRKLLAYAISKQQGFLPSEELKSDLDYGLISSWYEEFASGSGPSSKSKA